MVRENFETPQEETSRHINAFIESLGTKSHPECGPDEVFVGNHTAQIFQTLDWKQKRLGEVATDAHEQPLWQEPGSEKIFPVFVSEAEYEAAQTSHKAKKTFSDN